MLLKGTAQETPAQGCLLGGGSAWGGRSAPPKSPPPTTCGPAAHTFHTVLMVQVEVLIGVPAHSRLCCVVVDGDGGVVPWGVACGRPTR